MDGQEILRMIKDNKRLAKPENCPVIIYQLMWNCWQFNEEDRPTFQQICDRLESYLNNVSPNVACVASVASVQTVDCTNNKS